MSVSSTETIHDLLRDAITTLDHQHRYDLQDQIGRIGVVPARDLGLLMELLDADHWFAKCLAVWEMVKIGPDAAPAAPALAALAARTDLIIDPRWVSLWALERLGPAAASTVPIQLELLASEPDPDIRSEVAWSLGAANVVDGVVPGLEAALRDEDSLVREEAAGSLGRIGPAAWVAVGSLAELGRTDPVRPVREAVASALKRLGEAELTREVRASLDTLDPPPGLAPLLAKLESDDPRVRAEAAWPIGKHGSDASPGLDAVVNQLRNDHDPDARWGAAWVVGRVGPKAAEALPEIVAACREDPDPDVRAQVAQALGWIAAGDALALDTLVAALDDAGASYLREEAATALGRIGVASEQTLSALRARLIDPHQMVRLRAATALNALQGY